MSPTNGFGRFSDAAPAPAIELVGRAGCAVVFAMLLAAGPLHAQIRVVDDAGREVRLARPAERIVSLSPHATELLFAAGAGARVIGAVDYSDYPEAAKAIARIGDNQRLDVERIAGMKPDLVIAWQHGGERQTAQLRALNLTVYYSAPQNLDAIADAIGALATLAGTQSIAQPSIDAFRARLAALRQRHARSAPVRVLLQIWDRPLMTVNGQHLMSRALGICGGVNVFAGLKPAAPAIDVEAALRANPDVIIATGLDTGATAWRADWKRWPRLAAVKHGHLYDVPAALLTRQTPRILDGIEMMCGQLDQARPRH